MFVIELFVLILPNFFALKKEEGQFLWDRLHLLMFCEPIISPSFLSRQLPYVSLLLCFIPFIFITKYELLNFPNS